MVISARDKIMGDSVNVARFYLKILKVLRIEEWQKQMMDNISGHLSSRFANMTLLNMS